MPLDDQRTEQLLERVAVGSDAAAQQLIGEFRPRLRAMISVRLDRRLQARVDPSDVVQDVLLRAAHVLPEFARSRDIPFYPWLRQMAWERLVELHRQHVVAKKRTVTREAIDRYAPSDHSVDALVTCLHGRVGSPSADAVRKEIRARVANALNALDDISREVLLMHYVEQMKLREIAASLRITESATKSRHIRALEKLATTIGNVEDFR